MTRFIPLARRRAAVILQLVSYPLAFSLSSVAGLGPRIATVVALLGFAGASVYLYYKTGFWQFGHAPDEQLDERQVQIRNRAYRLAYTGVSSMVLLLLSYLLIAYDFHWPVPSSYDQASPLFWGVWTIVLTLPSAILAWTEPDV